MKSDKTTVLKRIQEIYQMMCQGASSVDIVEYGVANWNVGRGNMYKMMKTALRWIREKTEKSLDDLRIEANVRFDKLYTKLYKEGKYSDAGKMQALKNKVNGLEQIKLDTTSEIVIKITKEEIE